MKPRLPVESRYRPASLRRRVRSFIQVLEYYSLRFFGEDNCPFGQSGAIVVAVLVLTILSGFVLVFFYVPSPERAYQVMGSEVVSFVKAFHRVCADFLVLVILFHVVRVWASERFRGPRARNWIKGLVMLCFIGLVGWSGYVLPWDERAMVLLNWGRDLASSPDRWPILGWFRLGSIVDSLFFGHGGEVDILLRVFALHVGGAILVLFMVVWHLRRVTPPRVVLPIRAWLVLIALILVVGGIARGFEVTYKPFNPFAPPEFIYIDIIITFPLLFYPLLGAPLLSGALLVVWVGLALLSRWGSQSLLTAVVDESVCSGCRLCVQDCPYGAIIMVSKLGGFEVARVVPAYCNACGICVGSCEEGALELPDLRSSDILSRIERIVEGSGREALDVQEVLNEF